MIMSSLPKQRCSPAEYLARERQAERRSEYVNGEILAMDGASRAHNRIRLNVGSLLTALTRGTPCEPFASDMRVRVSALRVTYPDAVIACEPDYEDAALDVLLNPSVIFEVLSPSTEADDRGWKFAHYRRLETLMDYVLVSQERPFIEHFTRFQMDVWTLKEVSGLHETLSLPSVSCLLPLADVYERVTFSPDSFMPADE